MQRRFGIAMQVQHHIRRTRMSEQHTLHALQLAAGRWQCGQHIAHGLTDQLHIGVSIIPQAPFQQGSHGSTQLNEIAVEILAATGFEAPLMIALQQLPEPQWVGHRHQFDHTFQGALRFQFGQALFQLPGRAHPRQFVGVQAGLDIGLALAAAEAEHRNPAFAAQMAPRQSVIDTFHISASAEPGSPASDARRA
ncbi:hypothetical protein D3C78_1051200 [compost metagenome]